MNIAIEPLESDDPDTRLALLGYLSDNWKEPKEEIEREYITPSFTSGPPYILIAYTPERAVAGHIMLAIEKKGYLGIENQPWIYGLYVKEEFRSQGIARLLIGELEKLCRQQGYPYLYLDTVASEGYYRRIGGWEELGTDVWGPRSERVTIMRKKVD